MNYFCSGLKFMHNSIYNRLMFLRCRCLWTLPHKSSQIYLIYVVIKIIHILYIKSAYLSSISFRNSSYSHISVPLFLTSQSSFSEINDYFSQTVVSFTIFESGKLQQQNVWSTAPHAQTHISYAHQSENVFTWNT